MGYREGGHGSKILFESHAGEHAAHLGAGPERTDLDEGDGPAGELGDLLDGPVLEFEEGQDESGGRCQFLEGPGDEAACGVGVDGRAVGGSGVVLEPVGFLGRKLGDRLLAVALVGVWVALRGRHWAWGLLAGPLVIGLAMAFKQQAGLAVLACAVFARPLGRYAEQAAGQLLDRAAYVQAVLGSEPVAPALDVRKEMRERGESK